MFKEQCSVGMRVRFGRPQGEQTLGEVVKLNQNKAKVRTLEARGQQRIGFVGEIWVVPYGMLSPADLDTTLTPPQPKRFAGPSERQILLAIRATYAELSPENVSCDGELSAAQVRVRCHLLHDRLRHLFRAIGREVSESEAYALDEPIR